MQRIEDKIQYQFTNKDLLDEALTHPSMGLVDDNGQTYNYERLEFLGDSVLGLVIARVLFEQYPDEREGELAKRHAALVRGEALTIVANALDIGEDINMASGEQMTGGRQNKRNLENALEAIIGAMYIDGGLDVTEAFIRRHWEEQWVTMEAPPKDAKTSLQEWAQHHKIPIPEYTLEQCTGPSHAPKFEVAVSMEGFDTVTATASSKKQAQKNAASKLLTMIEDLEQ